MTRSISRLVVLHALCALAILCSSSPAMAHPPAQRPAAVDSQPAQAEATERKPKPATDEELEGYAEREKKVSGLEKFEGGRGGAISVTTLLIILLIVLIIVIIV